MVLCLRESDWFLSIKYGFLISAKGIYKKISNVRDS